MDKGYTGRLAKALGDFILKATNGEPITRGDFEGAMDALSDLNWKAAEYDRIMGLVLSGKVIMSKPKRSEGEG